MNRKYELTNISMKFKGRTLYRIRALKDFYVIKKGDLGGWVSNEDNLSQEGYCWVYDNAKCIDNARMYDNSEMHDNSIMYDYSIMFNNSNMYDHSKMYDHSEMYDNSEMHDNSAMCDYSAIYNNGILKSDEKLYGKLVSRVDKFIDINVPSQRGRIITGVLKNDKVLYNVGCQDEITKEVFIDRIYNEDGGIKKHPYRKEYLKIIDMIELYFK